MKKHKKTAKLISAAVKIFLFPLFFFGVLLREYDKIFKKNKQDNRTIDVWY